jgi:hypothetical protein
LIDSKRLLSDNKGKFTFVFKTFLPGFISRYFFV